MLFSLFLATITVIVHKCMSDNTDPTGGHAPATSESVSATVTADESFEGDAPGLGAQPARTFAPAVHVSLADIYSDPRYRGNPRFAAVREYDGAWPEEAYLSALTFCTRHGDNEAAKVLRVDVPSTIHWSVVAFLVDECIQRQVVQHLTRFCVDRNEHGYFVVLANVSSDQVAAIQQTLRTFTYDDDGAADPVSLASREEMDEYERWMAVNNVHNHYEDDDGDRAAVAASGASHSGAVDSETGGYERLSGANPSQGGEITATGAFEMNEDKADDVVVHINADTEAKSAAAASRVRRSSRRHPVGRSAAGDDPNERHPLQRQDE